MVNVNEFLRRVKPTLHGEQRPLLDIREETINQKWQQEIIELDKIGQTKEKKS